MRTSMLVAEVFGLTVLSATSAVTVDQNGKEVVVKEIDLKEFPAKWPAKSFADPTIITSEQDLAKISPDKMWQDKIAKQVDFTKEHLLFFIWSGSGGDKFSFKVENATMKPVVAFKYQAGQVDTKSTHWHLFAIAKGATWRVDQAK